MSKHMRSIFTILAASSIIFSFSIKASAYPTTSRIYGYDRYQTASEIAKTGWDTSLYAVIASGENFPDALSAAPLAKKYNAPILLTHKSYLNSNTKERLMQYNTKYVFIVGGYGVIDENVENELKGMGISIVRLAGADRYETSIKIAEQLDNVSTITVATGEEFSDAASVGPAAARDNMPIILVPKDDISQNLRDYILKRNINKAFVIGDSDLISTNVSSQLPNVERITGGNQYVRNYNIIKRFYSNYIDIYLATGNDYPDAIAAAVIASKNNSPLVLLNNSDINTAKRVIFDKDVSMVKVIGGYGAISEETLNNVMNNFVVSFPDNNLEGIIRKTINKSYGDIYSSDLYGISTLDAALGSIKNLSGIEYLLNLNELYLEYNEISDISPISKLTNLRVLHIQDNNISDIAPVKSLVNLTEARFDSNYIQDISSLGSLTKIVSLDLRCNNISSIEALKNSRRIRELHLSDNKIIDYSAVSSFYNNIINKDFDLQVIPQNSSGGFVPSQNQISGRELRLIKDFEEKYSTAYEEYSILYHSVSNSYYKEDLDKLINLRAYYLERVSDVNLSNDETKMLNETLEDIYNKISTIQNFNKMNIDITELEGSLGILDTENERKTIRNKINLIYSDYMQNFYAKELSICINKISHLESDIQTLAKDTSDLSRAKVTDMLSRVNSLKSDKSFLQSKKDLYNNLYYFYNALNSVFTNDDIY